MQPTDVAKELQVLLRDFITYWVKKHPDSSDWREASIYEFYAWLTDNNTTSH